MKKEDSPTVEPSIPKQGPGDRLQAARIAKGMTLEDVTSKMHLSTCILASLEENNFNEITAPIFVKGYLRAYSRLVNIDEDDIIKQYAAYYMNGDPPISSTSNTLPSINSNDSRVKWITYIIILGLITLLSLWWWNRYQQSPETLSLDSADELHPQTEMAKVKDINNQPVQQQSPLQNIQSASIDPVKESLQLEIKTVVDSLKVDTYPTEPVAEGISITEPDYEQTTLAESVELNAGDEEPQTISVSSPEPVSESSTMEQSPTDLSPAQSQASINVSSEKALVITVHADTWASIKDATGKKLVYDLLRSGQKITVSGESPISAFLGNGYGVSMKYKGEEVDLTGYIKSDNTARIQIGQ